MASQYGLGCERNASSFCDEVRQYESCTLSYFRSNIYISSGQLDVLHGISSFVVVHTEVNNPIRHGPGMKQNENGLCVGRSNHETKVQS